MSRINVSIQLKRKKQTFFLIMKQNSTINDIKNELHSVIESIGGLGDGEEFDVDEIEENDIPVPSFETMDSDDEDREQMNDIKSSTTKTIPELDEITLGEPRDVNDPYASGFTDVKDPKVELVDFKIFGFRLDGEDYEIIEPLDEE